MKDKDTQAMEAAFHARLATRSQGPLVCEQCGVTSDEVAIWLWTGLCEICSPELEPFPTRMKESQHSS